MTTLGLSTIHRESRELLERVKKLKAPKTVIIENVRGQWVVDETTTGVFQEEGYGYGDGALMELKVLSHKSLCCHPDNPAVCPHKES